MDRAKVPSKIVKNNRVYIYQEQCNDKLVLYKEEKVGFRECFTIQDLVKIKNKRKQQGAKV